RRCRNRSENRAKLQRHSIAAPRCLSKAKDGCRLTRRTFELAVDSEKVRALRERLFGNWEMNWVGFNYARDFTLPGQKDGPIGFLMYPYAEAPDGPIDSLDPASFTYSIFAQEIV